MPPRRWRRRSGAVEPASCVRRSPSGSPIRPRRRRGVIVTDRYDIVDGLQADDPQPVTGRARSLPGRAVVTATAEQQVTIAPRAPRRWLAWLDAARAGAAARGRQGDDRAVRPGLDRRTHRPLARSGRLPRAAGDPVGIGGWLGGPPSRGDRHDRRRRHVRRRGGRLSGRRWSIAGPLFAVGFLWLTTFGASWGQILHTEHLAALHLLVLAAAPSVAGRRRPTGWPLKVMTLVTVGVYVVAGIAKFRFGGGWSWLDGDRLAAPRRPRQPSQTPARRHLLADRRARDRAPAAVPGRGVAHARRRARARRSVFFGRRRLRHAWMAMAWTFHVGVLALMAVLFPYPLFGSRLRLDAPRERLVSGWGRPQSSRFMSPCTTSDVVHGDMNSSGGRFSRGGTRERVLGLAAGDIEPGTGVVDAAGDRERRLDRRVDRRHARVLEGRGAAASSGSARWGRRMCAPRRRRSRAPAAPSGSARCC